jgi:hypothetical protein
MPPFQTDIKKQQWDQLKRLLKTAQKTEVGKQYDFGSIAEYQEFARRVPVHSYDSIKGDIKRLKDGASNIYWPGNIQQFAVSAGTSGEGKHLPFTDQRRQSDKRFMRKIITSYVRQRPNILNLMGKQLSMPGSIEWKENYKIGEISGFTALNAPSWLRIFQVVDPRLLTTLSFQEKFDLLVNEALDADLKVITAVPSWILTLFQQVLERTGKSTIADIWPNLKLLVCGGVKLDNYRSHLQELARGLNLDFIETYGASEGYIGYSNNLQKRDLKMVTDNGIFFECVPNPSPKDDPSDIDNAQPLWKVKTDVPYALLMTTNAGLWRYTLNDIVEFTSLNPLRFMVKGRVRDMLDDFGEALYIYEAEQTLQSAAKKMETEVGNFSISPVMQSENAVPHHRWFVQFINEIDDVKCNQIAKYIDKQLRKINRHYAIRRESDALGRPEVIPVSQSDINAWMRKNGKAEAQGKFPKVLPKNTEALL